jgi:DNA primase
MRAEGAAFPEAVERLAAEAGLDVPKPSPQEAARERRARDLHAVMAAAAEAYHRRLFLPEGRPALDYLLKRGMTEATIRAFMLGWAPSGRGAIAADLKPEDIAQDQLVEAGLLRPGEAGEAPRDFFYARVMFPIRDRRGRVIAFGGRILGDGQPKYVNSPETPLFRKRMGLYGLDLAREGAFRGAPVVAVEGYMDVIALHQAGFTGAVAPLGTALTVEQLEELWRLNPEPVLCFDGDAAGARAAARAAETALPLISTDRTLRFATLPDGQDPDTLTARGGRMAFQAVLDAAQPMAEALYGLITEGRPAATPEQRAALRNRLAGAAGTIADKALAAEYRRVLLDRFFAASRPARGGRPAPRRAARPAIGPAPVQAERARMLLAIVLRHPWLLPQVEEGLGLLDLPDGTPAQLRAAILAWHPGAERVDSEGLIAHLAQTGFEDAASWALSPAGLPLAARPEALPGEVEEGFWHFFARLGGEAGLREQQQEALTALIETNDPIAELRLKRLSEQLEAIRRGDEAAVASGDAA